MDQVFMILVVSALLACVLGLVGMIFNVVLYTIGGQRKLGSRLQDSEERCRWLERQLALPEGRRQPYRSTSNPADESSGAGPRSEQPRTMERT